jgi:hypothetical protein
MTRNTSTSASDFGTPSLSIALDLAKAVVPGKNYSDPQALAEAVLKFASLPDIKEMIDALPGVEAGKSHKTSPSPLSQVEEIRAKLELLRETPGALENFALVFAERAFLKGEINLDKLTPAATDLIRRCGETLKQVAQLGKSDCAPKGTLKSELLRKVDRELVDFIKPAGSINARTYVILNEQHKQVAQAKTLEDQALLASSPKFLRDHLSSHGLTLQKSVRGLGENATQEMARLVETGVVDRAEIPGTGTLILYAGAKIDSKQFEALISPKLREKIGDALWEEFNTKYSGSYRPIGIHSNRENGIPTLTDRMRVSAVADKVGVPPSLVVLALKYFENYGLVRVRHENNGFELSPIAKKVGLGMRSVRHSERLRSFDATSNKLPTLEEFCKITERVRDGWKLPEYSLQTEDGGAPWVHLVDELLFPNARIDGELLKAITQYMSERPGLVIASNMTQGHPAVYPRDQRTSVQARDANGIPVGEYATQLEFVKRYLQTLNQPTICLFGKRDLETANLRADVQRWRDQQHQRGSGTPSERTVGEALARLNDIELNAGRKYAARLQAENLLFISNVAIPFEFKLGRQLLSSEEIHSRIGLRINEIEILRDVTAELVNDLNNGTESGRARMLETYRDFFALPEVGPKYLKKLEQVIFPKLDQLSRKEPVARGGAAIQLKTKKGTDGLSIVALPEFKLGISELRDPGKLVSMLNSRAVSGRSVSDIVVCGGVGAPFFIVRATGQAIVTPGSLQASNFDDLYSYTESADGHKRRRAGMGEERQAGFISFKGGVDKGIKTSAYTLQLTSNKIEEVLRANRSAKKAEATVEIFQTNDLQLGSPTAQPSTFIRGLMWAVQRGVKDIVLDGDLIQGQNYGRFYAEAQMTGIIGIGDQQAFLSTLFQPVIDCIVRCKKEDPSYVLPKFRIVVGNHEMNSQAGKGAQGIWYMEPLYNQIYSSYRAAFGEKAAEGKVVYPRKYVAHDGTNVDYPMDVLDYTEQTGFRIAAQHYSGAGSKGSGSVPPIVQARQWNRSKENENREIHGWLWAHFHTQSITMADGAFHVIFGANATGSGFEHHLGYPLTVPAAGLVRLSSVRPPELQIVTDPLLLMQEQDLLKIPEYRALVSSHGSLEGWVEEMRKRHQGRNVGNAVSFLELKSVSARHEYINPHRKIS